LIKLERPSSLSRSEINLFTQITSFSSKLSSTEFSSIGNLSLGKRRLLKIKNIYFISPKAEFPPKIKSPIYLLIKQLSIQGLEAKFPLGISKPSSVA
jgi:hypothetical protein